MSSHSGYYRYPAVHGDRVVFTSEDDLWTVPLDGGIARRLTGASSRALLPVISPDGERIAFCGREDGPPEVYVMDAHGGEARRLTWAGSVSMPAAWSRDGKEVLYASNRGQPFLGALSLHAVPVDGGPSRRLPYGLARTVSFEPGGEGVVVGVNTGDPARWKRYRGGTAGRLWIDREGTGVFRPLLELAGNLGGPMWIGTRIWFLSDHEGYGNLYSCTPTGRGLKRHTDHDDFYVRFPATDGKTIVYHAGADLFRYDVGTHEESRIEIGMHSPRRDRQRTFAPAAKHLETARLHPRGHSVAVVTRGSGFSMALFEGAPRRHDAGSRERLRLLRWLPDGKRLVGVSDLRGEEEIVVHGDDNLGKPKRHRGDFGRILELEAAPAGADRVAFTNHRQEVWSLDLKSGKATRIEKSAFDRIAGISWSPDGKWLAYGFAVTRASSAIHLWDATHETVHEITRPEFMDLGPVFDPGGKYLYFLSHRVFDPVYDNQGFDLGFPRGAQPCLLTLDAKTPSPFVTATREPKSPGGDGDGPPDAKGKGKKEEKKEPATPKVEVDVDGMAERVVAFPIEEQRYTRVVATPGRAWFLHGPVAGSLVEPAEDEPRGTLRYFDFAKNKVESVKGAFTTMSASLDGKTLLLRSGKRLRAVVAEGEVAEAEPGAGPGRESGFLDLARLRVVVEPGDEWRQMFAEAWRLQRDQFWTEDMSHVDWNAVLERYLPLVDRCGSRGEFSDLLWEMQGELGTSHCYEMGGDYRPVPDYPQALLGADLRWDPKADAWVIGRLPRGDSWSPAASSPLSDPGLDVREGDLLVAVDGVPLDAGRTPGSCLVHKAGCDVRLTVRRPGARGKPREIAVRTLRAEFDLRYRDWVRANREKVHAATKGRVGYLHVPDMGPRGFAEFHRAFRNEMDKDGLIVDVRWNGGGHVSQLLLEKLARKRVGYDLSRWQGAMPYPTEAPVGPMVALTNEYAGSDGDIFSHCFKLYGLGPLIGKRTWGGVVGIWPRHALVDGTVTSQPEFSFWFTDVGWKVENYGTDPDIEVELPPHDHAAGRDPQLDRAVAELLAILKKAPPRPPELTGKPDLRPPRLPKG